jgi:serine/threonine protein kinase
LAICIIINVSLPFQVIAHKWCMMADTPGTATGVTPAGGPSPKSDRLELLQQMNAGSLGTVHKARNPKLDRMVALRQLQVPEWLDDADAMIKRILAEARAANSLQHPNIARLYTGGHKGFTIFLTSEFIEGIGIREYATGRNLGVAEIAALAKQLCAALDYAHGKNVLHQALTPSNIKVLSDGTLKVLDFGLLREKELYSPSPAKRLENEHYRSPEQIRNQPFSPADNIFSAATILYELFTTRNPFSGKHLGEVDRNIAEVDPAPASQVHGRVSEALSRVLMKALAKNPAARYQSCNEFALALDAALQSGSAKPAASVHSQPISKPVAQSGPGLSPASNGSAPLPKPALSVAAAQAAASHGPSGGGVPLAAAIPPKAAAIPKPAAPVDSNKDLPAAAPRKMSAKARMEWKLVGGMVIAIFVVAAMAISLAHRSRITPPVQVAHEETQQKPLEQPEPQVVEVPTNASDAATPNADEPATVIDTDNLESRIAKPRKAKGGSTAAPVASDGQLSITSEPEGAGFAIEGKTIETWKTPQVVGSLAPALYKVTVSKAGYSTETRSIQVTAGNRVSLSVKLTALKATVSIAGTPTGAGIVIDGKDTGKFSPAQFILDPAVHTITLRKEGFFENTSQVTLVAGQTLTYSPSLLVQGRTDNIKVVGGIKKKLFGGGADGGTAHLEIKSDPKGAQILLNGAPLSKATPVEIQLEPGNYEITLQKDGYQTLRKMIVIGATDKVTLDEHLSK